MAKIDSIRLRKESNGFFNEYLPSEETGKLIFDSFIKFFVPNKGFPLDNKYNETCGTISNCMALSILLELELMGVDISKFDMGFKFLIEDMFDRVYNQKRKLTFDASPYIFNNDSEEISIDTYIETVSKICIIALDLRSFAIKNIMIEKPLKLNLVICGEQINSFKRLKELAENLIIDSVTILVDSCLKIEDNDIQDYQINGNKITRNSFPTKIEYRGWAFQKPQSNDSSAYDTSIYFTYHATNAFISIYNELKIPFEQLIKPSKIDQQSDEWKKYEKFDKCFFDNNKELFIEFRNMTSSTGRYIDTILKNNDIDIAFDYIKSNFKKISASEIIDSPKNNYVIDTLFVLAIMINAGIDEDYSSVNQLDYFYEQLQAAITNLKIIYNSLKRNNREDLINSYRLIFNERCPSEYKKFLKMFRRKSENIAVYDFVPLLCNTYAIISEYLIQYPQKEMIDNLEIIMDNCIDNDEWYWDKNGFNVNNNLYYIFAIGNFYEYYKKYELPSSEKGKKYNDIALKAKRNLEDKIKEFNVLQKEKNELSKKLENKKSSLDLEVSKIAESIFLEKIDERIFNYLQSMIEESYSLIIKARDSSVNLEELLNDNQKAKMLFKVSKAIENTKIKKNFDMAMHKIDGEAIREFDEAVVNEILRSIRGGN